MIIFIYRIRNWSSGKKGVRSSSVNNDCSYSVNSARRFDFHESYNVSNRLKYYAHSTCKGKWFTYS